MNLVSAFSSQSVQLLMSFTINMSAEKILQYNIGLFTYSYILYTSTYHCPDLGNDIREKSLDGRDRSQDTPIH